MKGATIFLADDDAAIRTVLTQYLQQQGFEVRATGSGSTLWQWVQAGGGDVVVSDVVMPDADGLDLLTKIGKIRPELPVLIMSARNTVLTALQANERGAFDYLPKPFDLQELADMVQKALEAQGAGAKDFTVNADLPITGSSSAMQGVYRLIAKIAPSDLTVLIRGESGTGKELVAKVLHDFGARRDQPFIALNMAAIPADLVESDLFGHERGAFTGAEARKEGRFAQAEKGTLFLDEIGDMPLSTQTRLLRVLQERTYTRVGGVHEIRADVRIIAATHRDLESMVRAGEFREDLFYRLNVVPLTLPPLRDRLDDLPELVPVLAQGLATPGMPAKTFTPKAIDALSQYNWPGNVRELENFIQRLMAVLPQSTVNEHAVYQALNAMGNRQTTQNHPIATSMPEPVSQTLEIEKILETYVDGFFAQDCQGIAPGQIYEHFLNCLERPLLEQTLKITKGNQIQAAALLGLNRNTLRKKISKLGIRVVRGHGASSGKLG